RLPHPLRTHDAAPPRRRGATGGDRRVRAISDGWARRCPPTRPLALRRPDGRQADRRLRDAQADRLRAARLALRSPESGLAPPQCLPDELALPRIQRLLRVAAQHALHDAPRDGGWL